MTTSYTAYLESISGELASQCKRVRQLIGNRHWLSDGTHHESVLCSLISRHIGSRFQITKGFVLPTAGVERISKEQDILIIDPTIEAPIFHQYGLTIVDPRTVVAAISVKATLRHKSLEDGLLGLSSIDCRRDGLASDHGSLWRAIFFFSTEDAFAKSPSQVASKLCDYAEKHNVPAPKFLNFICVNEHYVLKYEQEQEQAQVRGNAWEYGQLSASIFLANLADHLAGVAGRRDCTLVRAAEALSVDPVEAKSWVVTLTQTEHP